LTDYGVGEECAENIVWMVRGGCEKILEKNA
jgi:hypothetical protein